MPSTSILALVATAAVGSLASPLQPRAAPFDVELEYFRSGATMADIVDHDRARIGSVFAGSKSSGRATNIVDTYLANVNVGGRIQKLLIDTGSSNTWCGAHGACEPTSSGQNTGNAVSVSYGSGSFSGTEYIDRVGFGGKTVKSQSVGSAKKSKGFVKPIDGIIGFGPVALTANTVNGQATVPTFMNNLYSEGLIPVEVLGVSYRPEPGSANHARNGLLTLGGTAPSRYQGAISYHPRATGELVGNFWAVSVDSFGSSGLGLATGADCVVDTGTTLVYIPPTALAEFALTTGGDISDSEGLLRYTSMPTENFDIVIGSKTYTLTPDEYVIPKAQYKNLGLSAQYYWTYLGDGAETLADGIECILGFFFIEQYYSVFDNTHNRVGFAKGK